jgi:hypothetical protein
MGRKAVAIDKRARIAFFDLALRLISLEAQEQGETEENHLAYEVGRQLLAEALRLPDSEGAV